MTSHSRALALAAGLAMALAPAGTARAQQAFGPVQPGLAQDSALAGLVRRALASRPELAEAQAAMNAERARVGAAGAFPDPVLSVGLEYEGEGRYRIRELEKSGWWVTAAQTLPLFGKRGLGAQAQWAAAKQAEADLDRVRLTTRADVERAYVDLLLARDRLTILGRLEASWTQAEGLSRSRYEAGDGAQSDILRAQLERQRLVQQRWALRAEERRQVAILERLAGGAELALPSAASLAGLADPALPDSAAAAAEAEARSPELRRARLGVDRSAALRSLAGRGWLPDLTLSGGMTLMQHRATNPLAHAMGLPVAGDFETRYQAGVSFPLPLWGGRLRSEGREARARADAARGGADAVRLLLAQRLEERRALLGALLETNRLYRSGLLIQSEATVASTMAQYQVGRVTFASVLESLRGYFTDLVGFHESVAAAHRIDIAQRELSLESAASAAFGGGGATIPGAGEAGGMGSASPAAAPAPPASTSTRMPGM